MKRGFMKTADEMKAGSSMDRHGPNQKNVVTSGRRKSAMDMKSPKGFSKPKRVP